MNKINLGKEYGARLLSRQAGTEIRTSIDIGGWEIDFSDVCVISHSFADECFAFLVRDKGPKWFMENIKLVNLEYNARYIILKAILLRIYCDIL